MNTDEVQHYFADLARDLAEGSDAAGKQVRFDVDMGFKPYRVVANDIVCDDITVVTLDGDLDIQAGEYVFCLLYTSPSPRDYAASRMPSSA